MLHLLAPGLPEDAECPKGCVVGVVWVERAAWASAHRPGVAGARVKLSELRQELGCECDSRCPRLSLGGAMALRRRQPSPDAGLPLQPLSDICTRIHGFPVLHDPPHAVGPFCNILSAAKRLPRPVPCTGGLGCWRLPAAVQAEVAKQLDGLKKKAHAVITYSAMFI